MSQAAVAFNGCCSTSPHVASDDLVLALSAREIHHPTLSPPLKQHSALEKR